MEHSADHGGRRGAELAVRIAASIPRLSSLEEYLNQAVELTGVPANTGRAKLMFIYRLLKIIQMGGQDMEPRVGLASALIAVALGVLKCGLLIYLLLGHVHWPMVFLCILMAFAFNAN